MKETNKVNAIENKTRIGKMARRVNQLHTALFILFAIGLSSSVMAQQVKTIAPDIVYDNETFQVQYVISSMLPIDEKVWIPQVEGFELQGEPMIQRSGKMLSARSSESFCANEFDDNHILTVLCSFKATQLGDLKLPSIGMMSDGTEMKSKSEVISVLKTPVRENVDCFVQLEASKQSLKLGDTLSIDYKLYSSKEISKIIDVNTPIPQAFYYQDHSKSRISYEQKTIDGKIYYIYTIKSLVLKTRKLGTFKLSKGDITVEYTYPSGRELLDGWGNLYKEQLLETKVCVIEPLQIKVHNMLSI